MPFTKPTVDLTVKLFVEDDIGGGEVDVLAVIAGFPGTVFAIHAAVLPFDGEGAGVLDVVEGADDFFEIDVAAAH